MILLALAACAFMTTVKLFVAEFELSNGLESRHPGVDVEHEYAILEFVVVVVRCEACVVHTDVLDHFEFGVV